MAVEVACVRCVSSVSAVSHNLESCADAGDGKVSVSCSKGCRDCDSYA